MDKKRRRYTLDQIEREEFKETETEISEPEVGLPFFPKNLAKRPKTMQNNTKTMQNDTKTM